MQSFPTTALLVSLVAMASTAEAVTLGQADTFSSAIDGWFAGGGPIGAVPPNPPTVVGTGGPAGAGDRYLSVTGLGSDGPGGRLVAMNGAQWSGDYTAAGITAIAMDLNNFGPSDLVVRLFFEDPQNGPPANQAVTPGVTLPAGSGWQHVLLPVLASDLTVLAGDASVLLGNTTLLRIFHGPTAAFPGPAVVGSLGIDNISAVPAPGALLLMLTGLAALAARAARPGR